jgi:preprotein translocase subunit SecD
MKRITFFAISMLIITSSMILSQVVLTKNLKIPDGFYLILNQTTDTTQIKADSGVVITYNHLFLDSSEAVKPEYLQIDTNEYVPLELELLPDSVVQPDKRIQLLLTLSHVSKDRLSDFTGKYLNRHVAIIINNKAISTHTIRSKITEGKIKISRCTDKACSFLFIQFKNKLKNKK